jgi:hypothetical protein
MVCDSLTVTLSTLKGSPLLASPVCRAGFTHVAETTCKNMTTSYGQVISVLSNCFKMDSTSTLLVPVTRNPPMICPSTVLTTIDTKLMTNTTIIMTHLHIMTSILVVDHAPICCIRNLNNLFF